MVMVGEPIVDPAERPVATNHAVGSAGHDHAVKIVSAVLRLPDKTSRPDLMPYTCIYPGCTTSWECFDRRGNP
jgi:hypothetical protein